MNIRRLPGRLAVWACTLVLGLVTVMVAEPTASPAGAATPAGTLSGEGGTFLQPIMSKLWVTDAASIAPEFGSYTGVALDSGIADFVGSGPGQFGADYAVTERPLTTAEAAAAKANGRSFIYVPFAATPVAIVTTVPSQDYGATTTISPTQFCQHIPLDSTQMGEIFGHDAAQPLLSWGDSRLQCAVGSATPPYSVPVARCANLDPTMENYAAMAYLDSDPTSKSLFDAGLALAVQQAKGTTTDDTPSEQWPYTGCGTTGGDQPFLGNLIGINAKTNAPTNVAGLYKPLGAAAPVANDWTGAPLGVIWDLPTAAIQNHQGSYVPPSAASAAAAEADATVSSSNLVTFNPSATDAAAYNSYLMEESYLVVPTSGLPPDKAVALAQFIRFALGTTGQNIIRSYGAAPATAAMTSTGLEAAAALDATVTASTGTTTTTAPTSTTTTAPTGSTTTTTTSSPIVASSTPPDNGFSSGSGSGGGGSSSGLAFTGAAGIVPLTLLGAFLAVTGAALRRRSRRKAMNT